MYVYVYGVCVYVIMINERGYNLKKSKKDRLVWREKLSKKFKILKVEEK